MKTKDLVAWTLGTKRAPPARFALLVVLACLPSFTTWAEPTDDFIKTTAVSVADLTSLPSKLSRDLSGYSAILVGEMHGTNESPAFTLGLVNLLKSNGKKVLLALEIPSSAQDTVNRFLNEGHPEILRETRFFDGTLIQDGRSSQAMVKLLSGARSLGIPVLCFDSTNGVLTHR